MWEKILNFFGFASTTDIAEQYTSGYEDWQNEHREWNDLKPLTFE